MRVRQLDATHDWTFGKGRNNYVRDNAAVAQNINTRLNSFLGDCFFDLTAGIDWFNRLGAKDRLALELEISTTILNTDGVTGLTRLSFNNDPTTRNYTVVYTVQTIYSTLTDTFVFSQNSGA